MDDINIVPNGRNKNSLQGTIVNIVPQRTIQNISDLIPRKELLLIYVECWSVTINHRGTGLQELEFGFSQQKPAFTITLCKCTILKVVIVSIFYFLIFAKPLAIQLLIALNQIVFDRLFIRLKHNTL